jgi:transcription elongation factor Elf1
MQNVRIAIGAVWYSLCGLLSTLCICSDQQNKVGHLSCKVCDVSWQCPITYLDEAVDVYSAWIDACENVNKDRGSSRRARGDEDEDQEEEEDSRQRRTTNYEDEDDDDDY